MQWDFDKMAATMKNVSFTLICALSCFVLLTASAQAAGLWLFEQGTPDLGAAAAGRAAMAKDASTAFGNPAGMTRLKDSQLTVGAQTLFPQIKFNADDSSFGGGSGGSAGVLISPREGTRFGIQYRSKVDLEYEDKPDLSGVGPLLQAALNLTGLAGSNVKLDMELPQAVLASAYHEFTDKLAIMGNVGWQNWSSFGNIDVSINSDTSTSATQDLGYDDTWHFALGGQYRIAKPWLLSIGAAYDTSPADSAKKRTPAMPFDRQYRLAAGLQYELNPDVTLGAAYQYLDLGDANINRTGGLLRGDLKGKYKKNEIHFLGVNLICKF